MTDAELVEAFEATTLPPEQFPHAQHVRLGFLYLRRHETAEALARFSAGLRRYAAAQGKPDRYHETITWAYLLLIHERMARLPEATGFDAFAAANPDLLAWRPSLLDAYYAESTLASDLARKVFLLPDRGVRSSSCASP